MTDLTLTKTRFRMGVWEGLISGAGAEAPGIDVMYLDRPVSGVALDPAGEGCWTLSVQVPVEAVADGVQTFTVFDRATDTRLGAFTLVAGDPVADDIRAEIELLRAELDMLKRAFRRHCLETA